jgi:hypothetical protein
VVNVDDLTWVLAKYNQTLSGVIVDGSGLDGQAIGMLGAAGVKVVPEPGTLAMLFAGLIGLIAYAWRKQK